VVDNKKEKGGGKKGKEDEAESGPKELDFVDVKKRMSKCIEVLKVLLLESSHTLDEYGCLLVSYFLSRILKFSLLSLIDTEK
jgi:hypothetical protein